MVRVWGLDFRFRFGLGLESQWGPGDLGLPLAGAVSRVGYNCWARVWQGVCRSWCMTVHLGRDSVDIFTETI